MGLCGPKTTSRRLMPQQTMIWKQQVRTYERGKGVHHEAGAHHQQQVGLRSIHSKRVDRLHTRYARWGLNGGSVCVLNHTAADTYTQTHLGEVSGH